MSFGLDPDWYPPDPPNTVIRVEVYAPESGLRWAAHVAVPQIMLDDEPAVISHSLTRAWHIFERDGTG